MTRLALVAVLLACLVVLGHAADKPVKELQIGVKVGCVVASPCPRDRCPPQITFTNALPTKAFPSRPPARRRRRLPVQHKPESCDRTTRNGDHVHVHYTVS